MKLASIEDVRSVLFSTDITSLNKLPYHSPLKQEGVQSLNGQWQFTGYDQFDKVPWNDLFSKPGDLQQMPVPGNWELNGFGKPKYINTRYTFEADTSLLTPPIVPDEENPVGVYRHQFKRDSIDSDQSIVLAFNGFEGALFVYLNQEFIGYASNGRSISEFDISHGVQEDNELIVCLVSFGAGTWLECQDMWRLKGIMRDVYLYTAPKCRLFDHYTVYKDDVEPSLHIEAKILNTYMEAVGPHYIEMKLFDMDGEEVPVENPLGFTGNLSNRYDEVRFNKDAEPIFANTISTAYIKALVPKPRLWSPEDPYLYNIELILTNERGEVVSQHRYPFGFRTIEMRGPEFYLNGQSIKFRGVNRHEFHPRTGHVVSRADMEEDIRLMKRANVNAVRSAHYPQDPYWYELCDRYGLMVMDEANAETHGLSYRRNLLPGNDPRWLAHYLERIRSIVETNKNHSSIVMWSLGNEIGFGDTVAIAASVCRAMDPTRYIHKRQMNSIADMDSETYPSVEDMLLHAKTKPNRPFLTNEYAHAMGNSMGNLKEYWDAILKHKSLIGGFVWEWCDHGLEDPNGGGYLYGGDFDEAFHDGNFCIDGIVTPDRRETPKLQELKKVHESIFFEEVDLAAGKILITNGYQFTNLEIFDFHWQLLADGVVIEDGALEPLFILPNSSAIVKIPFNEALAKPGLEHVLHLSVRTKDETLALDKGHEVAWSDFILDHLNKQDVYQAEDGVFCIEDTEDKLQINSLVFSKETGRILSFGSGLEDLHFQAYRAPTDNDIRSSYFIGRKGFPFHGSSEEVPSWHKAGIDSLDSSLIEFSHKQVDRASVQVSTKHRYTAVEETGFIVTTIYHLFGDDSLLLETAVEPYGDLPILPRLGLVAKLDQSFEEYSWYGLGPLETYPDRKASGKLSQHQAHVMDALSYYIKPQECGNYEATRSLKITNGTDSYLFTSIGDMSMSALPYSAKELSSYNHVQDLPKPTATYISLDSKQVGLGNRSCGPEVLDEYLLHPRPVYFAFSVKHVEMEGDTDKGLDSLEPRPDFAPYLILNENVDLDLKVEHPSSLGVDLPRYKDPSDPDARSAIGMHP